MNLLSFIFPIKIETFFSDFNGEIKVMEFLGRKSIEVDGLMQSGPLLKKIFLKCLKHFHIAKSSHVKRILLLGLGGGTLVQILKDVYPETYLRVIEIDPVMKDVANKYFRLKQFKNVDIVIGDVFSDTTLYGSSYDLIIVDLFKGYHIPKELNNTAYLSKLKALLSNNGCVIFNRLYFQKYVSEADFFLDKAKQIFNDVEVARIYFNIFIKAC